MSLQGLIKEKREQILEIAAKHGAFNVRVFGSVARGEDTENSDLDFLIDYDLEDLLKCKVDVVTEQGLKARIRERVLAECVVL